MLSERAVMETITILTAAGFYQPEDFKARAWKQILDTAGDGRGGRFEPMNITDEELVTAARKFAATASNAGRWLTTSVLIQAVQDLRRYRQVGRAELLRREEQERGRLEADDLADDGAAWTQFLRHARRLYIEDGKSYDEAREGAYRLMGRTPPPLAGGQPVMKQISFDFSKVGKRPQ